MTEFSVNSVPLRAGMKFRTSKYSGTILEVTLDHVKFKENGSKPFMRQSTPFAFWRGIAAGLIEVEDPVAKLMEELEEF